MAEIGITLFHTESVTPEIEAIVRQRLPERYEKSMRYLREEPRLQSLAAGALLLKRTRIDRESEYETDAAGKPRIAGERPFSLSHSGTLAGIAIGQNAPVGLDVELVREHGDYRLRQIFTEEEIAYIGSDPRRFTEIFTLKEALLKANGCGFRGDAAAFSALDLKNGGGAWFSGKQYFGMQFFYEEYSVAVSAEEPVSLVRIEVAG